MLRNVMLPLDGSSFSELATQLAISIAKLSSATLHVVRVHVTPAPTAEVTLTTNYDELLRQNERAALERVVATAEKDGVSITSALLDGPVAVALNDYIQSANIDLVVMTTHGRGGITRLVLGSVAEQLVRTSDVPVLLLRPDVRASRLVTVGKFSRILVPLDGSGDGESVLPHAVAIARLTQAEILLTRMAVAPFDIAITLGQDSLRAYVRRLHDDAEAYIAKVASGFASDVRVRTLVESPETVAAGILECAQRERADLIAMATHAPRGWERVAVGSVAESVMHKASVPVMLVHVAATAGFVEDGAAPAVAGAH